MLRGINRYKIVSTIQILLFENQIKYIRRVALMHQCVDSQSNFCVRSQSNDETSFECTISSSVTLTNIQSQTNDFYIFRALILRKPLRHSPNIFFKIRYVYVIIISCCIFDQKNILITLLVLI